MAGIIVLESGDWYVSGAGFRAMAEGVSRRLSDCQAGVDVKEALTLAVASGLYFLDVAGEFNAEMIKEFEKALRSHINEAKAADPLQLDDPEWHQGYVSRLAELQEKLGQAIKMPE